MNLFINLINSEACIALTYFNSFCSDTYASINKNFPISTLSEQRPLGTVSRHFRTFNLVSLSSHLRHISIASETLTTAACNAVPLIPLWVLTSAPASRNIFTRSILLQEAVCEAVPILPSFKLTSELCPRNIVTISVLPSAIAACRVVLNPPRRLA